MLAVMLWIVVLSWFRALKALLGSRQKALLDPEIVIVHEVIKEAQDRQGGIPGDGVSGVSLAL